MNLKMSFLATVSVALFAISANAEIIHESDFEAESTTGFGIGAETMLFTDGGGDLIGFAANGNTSTTGDALGISASNPNSGSFAYVVDVGATDPLSSNGWGAAWCGINTENGSGGFTTQAAAEENVDGCYVDFSAGATFTVTCQVATDPLNPLTGTATGEVRLEFNDRVSGAVDLIPRQISTRLGAAVLTAAYQEVSISYTLTQADIDTATAGGNEINSVSAVIGIEGAGNSAPGVANSSGHILFDDFVFEVNSANVVVVGDGHAVAEPDVLKGDVDLNEMVDFSDIPAFIAVLQSGGFQAEADCDCDGELTFGDIPAFIDILQNQ